MVKKLLAGLALAMAALAARFRLVAEKQRADRAEETANKAQKALDHRILLETQQEQLSKQQQQELRDVEESISSGDRSHFNSDW